MNAARGAVMMAGAGILLSVGGSVALLSPALERAILQSVEAMQQTRRVEPAYRQKGWDFWTIDIENLAAELQSERARVRTQLESIEQRTARLAAEEQEFARVRSEVDVLRRQITERVLEIQADEAKNIRTLAASYAKLSPRGAVAIFREMDEETVVKILASMKPDIVGPIFEEMSRAAPSDDSPAKRAAILSEKLRMMKAARPSS